MKRFFSFILTLFILCSACPALGEVYVNKTPPEDWETRDLLRVVVFRTGEGDCMLLQAGGENMMIDAGPYKYRESLRDALKDRDVSHFKYLYSTHPHDDHIDGLRMIMYYDFEVEEFISIFPKDVHDTEGNQKKAMAVLDKKGIPYRQISYGDKLTLGNAEMSTYFWAEGRTLDAQCAMTKLTFGDCSALFTADIIGDTQHQFLKTLEPEILKADVLKAPHHGLTAMVPDFLTAVDPAYIWVTNYSTRGYRIKNQGERRKLPVQFSGDGTIVLECDGADWYIHQNLRQF